MNQTPSQTMPALFVGHGNPMNAIVDSPYSEAWTRLGRSLPRPKAILCVSAHWLSDRTRVLDSDQPKTIHDFRGFPEALYRVTYPCPGATAIVGTVCSISSRTTITPDSSWGIDHGTWSVLRRMYPAADIPVTQLSIDMTKPPRFHFDLGRDLSVLRDQGVLVVGSGNIVHNLGLLRWGDNAGPFDWAKSFDARVRDLILLGDAEPLIDFETLGEAASLSIPTTDHYLPLLYVLGLRRETDRVSFPVEGIDLGSVSMRAVLFS